MVRTEARRTNSVCNYSPRYGITLRGEMHDYGSSKVMKACHGCFVAVSFLRGHVCARSILVPVLSQPQRSHLQRDVEGAPISLKQICMTGVWSSDGRWSEYEIQSILHDDGICESTLKEPGKRFCMFGWQLLRRNH